MEDGVVKGNLTLRKIAELSHTSINTVSRALNQKDGVSQETRERILRIALEHNYRPNLMARSMRGMHTNLIGFLVEDVTNPYFVKMLAGAEQWANKEGMTLLIGSSNEKIDKERNHIDAFLSYRCSGLAMCLVSPDEELIAMLQGENVNFVILDASLAEQLPCDRICIDNEADSEQAVRYLIACGHRRIAIFIPEPMTDTERDRYRGYRRALRNNHVEEDRDLVKICSNKDTAYKTAAGLMQSEDPPTALYVAKQSLGLSVLSALLNLGLRIPEDVSMLIFGDPDWASIFHPTITCLQRQVEEMGRLGVEILMNKIRDEEPAEPRKIVLDSRLIVRESVKRL
jgi:LacI family transcriptional regulator